MAEVEDRALVHVVTVVPTVSRRRGWRMRIEVGYRWSCSCGEVGGRDYPDPDLAALDGVEHVAPPSILRRGMRRPR